MNKTRKIVTITSLIILFVVKTGFTEEPKPFGLTLGKSTRQEVEALIQKEGAKITDHALLKDIGDGIPSGNVFGLRVEGLKIDQLIRAEFWFYLDILHDNVLFNITYYFPISIIDRAEFYSLSDQPKAKYGPPMKFVKPNLTEGRASWKFGAINVDLIAPWIPATLTLTYSHKDLKEASEKADQQRYQEKMIEKGKTQKGF